jgi:flagellar basal-body rod protein FlgC
MDYSAAFAVSAAGMTAERTRVDVAALNLANANTVQEPGGAGYRPLRAVLLSGAGEVGYSGFANAVNRGLADADGSVAEDVGLPQVSVEAIEAPQRLAYEPGNPFANDKGFVTYASVDTASEMLTMMSAMRSYEANVAAMNMTKTLALKALEIGGGA